MEVVAINGFSYLTSHFFAKTNYDATYPAPVRYNHFLKNLTTNLPYCRVAITGTSSTVSITYDYFNYQTFYVAEDNSTSTTALYYLPSESLCGSPSKTSLSTPQFPSKFFVALEANILEKNYTSFRREFYDNGFFRIETFTETGFF